MTEIYALDLDEELLSHLPDPESWVVINGEDFSPELIEDEFVRECYAWQKQHIREHHKPATATVLANHFDLELVEPETAIGDLLDRLRERYSRNQQREEMRKLVKLQNEEPLAVPQQMIRMGRELSSLLSKRGEMFGTGDYDRALHRYEAKVARGPGASFGFAELDDYFYGMHGLTFWVAPPKKYKSWMMINGLVKNAEEGRAAWLYSLELPAEETDMRLRCLLADVPWWHYLRNCITTQEWKRIKEASDLIDGSGIFRISKPMLGRRSIDDLVYTARDAGADVVFIDQLQFVELATGESLGSLNKTGEYWGVLNRARELSDEGPVCIAHQFNRNTQFADSMPPIQMAKGSSAIEEFATLALGTWSNHDMMRSGILEVGTLIARNHQHAAWEMNIELTHGCSFEIIGRTEDDG